MRYHIQRMIKRRNSRNCFQRVALRINTPLLTVWRQITRKNLTIVDNAQLSGQAEHIKSPAHLVQGILLGYSEFGRDEVRNDLPA